MCALVVPGDAAAAMLRHHGMERDATPAPLPLKPLTPPTTSVTFTPCVCVCLYVFVCMYV